MKKVLIVAFIFFGGCFIIEKCNHPTNNSTDDYVNESSTTTADYESNSHSEPSQIATCPKCGKSYNKETWGEMCNTCWSDGKGLKSNGKSIIN